MLRLSVMNVTCTDIFLSHVSGIRPFVHTFGGGPFLETCWLFFSRHENNGDTPNTRHSSQSLLLGCRRSFLPFAFIAFQHQRTHTTLRYLIEHNNYYYNHG